MLRSRFWKNFDWWLFGGAALLSLVGILVIFSTNLKAASVASATDVRNQIIFLGLALAGFFLLAYLDYRVWSKLTKPLYAIMVGLLLVVMVLGKTALGATRWINLGFFQFQPSELAKLVLIIVLAKFFSDHYDRLDDPRQVLLSLAYLLVPLGLILAQPDLGTALVLIVIWLAMALISPMPKRYLVALAVAGLVLLPTGTHLLKPYQRARLDTFLQPKANPLGSGYNVVQSTIAVGSGQVFGRGLAAGSQSQLNFLPSQHTDFIFAVLAEKLGFVGGSILLVLFAALLGRALIVTYRAQDRFGLFLGVGIVAMLTFHILINVGMNMGIMPVTGIPLPFVSYGGTSLLISLAAVGLLESISIRRQKIQFGV
ncbi:MAG TPA: rod shape-determining protein RodA [Candidatus Saccharimonadales bacterium]|nr:rod shape-determining protein RodA [Candidatus Saccharimonadales bacterium]